MRKKIVVHIQSEVQFFSLKPLMLQLKKKYNLTVVIDDFTDDETGLREMAQGVREMLRKEGFVPKKMEDLDGEFFDIELAPYIDKRVKAKCHLKYEYGTMNVKPGLTHIPEAVKGFQGFLCQSRITNEILKVYGATFPVGNLKFSNEKRVNTDNIKRKKLFFAPTYNDQDDAEELEKLIKLLKTKYYVIIKGHHGTNYLNKNVEKKSILMELADEYYGSDVNVADLICRADVCLSGNSSVIADFLYAGVPCAIFAKSLDCFKMGDIHTTQYQLVKEGVLPWTNKVEKILDIVSFAMSKEYVERQKKAASAIFPKEYRAGVKSYLDVIEYFLNDPLANDYLLTYEYVFKQRELEVQRFEREKEKAERCLVDLETKITDNNKKKLYRLADKIYKLESKILKPRN